MNSDSFSYAGFGTGRNKLATVSAITSGALGSTGVFQIQTDSGTNLPYFASIPLQTGVIGTKSPIDVNMNASLLENNFGRPGADRGVAPFFSSSSFDGHPFTLQMQGRYTVATASTTAAPTISVYQCTAATMATALAAGISGNAALVSASNLLYSVAGTAVSTAGTYQFLAGSTMVWDSTAQILGGEFYGVNYGPAAGSTPVYASRAYTTGTAVTAYSNLNFFATLSFVGASSVVGVTPTEFTISAV